MACLSRLSGPKGASVHIIDVYGGTCLKMGSVFQKESKTYYLCNRFESVRWLFVL